MPGIAATNAFTASSWPIIAAEKIVGRAPWLNNRSAIGLLPTCAAASMQVSQSPKPQSIDARANAGCLSTSSRIRATLPCDVVTASLTTAGSCCGNASAAAMAYGRGGGAWPQALVASALIPSADSPDIEKNLRRENDMSKPPRGLSQAGAIQGNADRLQDRSR